MRPDLCGGESGRRRLWTHLEQFELYLRERVMEVRQIRVKIEIAAHSSDARNDPSEDFRALPGAGSSSTSPRRSRSSRTRSGAWITDDEATDPEYWVRHLREHRCASADALAATAGRPAQTGSLHRGRPRADPMCSIPGAYERTRCVPGLPWRRPCDRPDEDTPWPTRPSLFACASAALWAAGGSTWTGPRLPRRGTRRCEAPASDLRRSNISGSGSSPGVARTRPTAHEAAGDHETGSRISTTGSSGRSGVPGPETPGAGAEETSRTLARLPQTRPAIASARGSRGCCAKRGDTVGDRGARGGRLLPSVGDREFALSHPRRGQRGVRLRCSAIACGGETGSRIASCISGLIDRGPGLRGPARASTTTSRSAVSTACCSWRRPWASTTGRHAPHPSSAVVTNGTQPVASEWPSPTRRRRSLLGPVARWFPQELPARQRATLVDVRTFPRPLKRDRAARVEALRDQLSRSICCAEASMGPSRQARHRRVARGRPLGRRPATSSMPCRSDLEEGRAARLRQGGSYLDHGGARRPRTGPRVASGPPATARSLVLDGADSAARTRDDWESLARHPWTRPTGSAAKIRKSAGAPGSWAPKLLSWCRPTWQTSAQMEERGRPAPCERFGSMRRGRSMSAGVRSMTDLIQAEDPGLPIDGALCLRRSRAPSSSTRFSLEHGPRARVPCALLVDEHRARCRPDRSTTSPANAFLNAFAHARPPEASGPLGRWPLGWGVWNETWATRSPPRRAAQQRRRHPGRSRRGAGGFTPSSIGRIAGQLEDRVGLPRREFEGREATGSWTSTEPATGQARAPRHRGPRAAHAPPF